MKDFKIKVTEKENAIVQQTLFNKGYTWSTGDQRVEFTNRKFLYLENDKLSYGSDLEHFCKKSTEEISFNEFNNRMGITMSEEAKLKEALRVIQNAITNNNKPTDDHKDTVEDNEKRIFILEDESRDHYNRIESVENECNDFEDRIGTLEDDFQDQECLVSIKEQVERNCNRLSSIETLLKDIKALFLAESE